MAHELSYIWITPYSLLKSRTGGIISRTLAYSGLDLVGARMYMPSDELMDQCCELLRSENIEPRMKEGLLTYFNDYCRPDNKLGIHNRCLLLLFAGENAVERLRNAVGSLSDPQAQGNTVRGTYGEFVKHFEPAVFVGTDRDDVKQELRLFADYAQSDGGVLETGKHHRYVLAHRAEPRSGKDAAPLTETGGGVLRAAPLAVRG